MCKENAFILFCDFTTVRIDISLFSVLNNLNNISFLPEYAAVCGIADDEQGMYIVLAMKWSIKYSWQEKKRQIIWIFEKNTVPLHSL